MAIYQTAIKIAQSKKYPGVTLDQIVTVLKQTNNKIHLAIPLITKL